MQGTPSPGIQKLCRHALQGKLYCSCENVSINSAPLHYPIRLEYIIVKLLPVIAVSYEIRLIIYWTHHVNRIYMI